MSAEGLSHSNSGRGKSRILPVDAPREPLQLTNLALLRERCYVGGVWVEAASGSRLPVINPATGRMIGTVPRLSAAEVRRAIVGAGTAMAAWAAETARERARILHRWSALIRVNLEDLAYLVTAEQGKPLATAMREISLGASAVECLAEAARQVYGEQVPSSQSDRRRLTLIRPVGVCGAITPWQFPSALVARKAAAALAAGCTVVLKPAPQTPLSALALAALAEEAGVPTGVLNIVTGPAGEIARELATSALIRKLAFEGAPEIGQRLLRGHPDTVGKIAIERGGRAAMLIFDDANVERAVHDALLSTFRSADQPGICPNRLLIQRGIYDTFATQYVAAVRGLRVGPGIEPQAEIGPLIDEAAMRKVTRQISDARAQGAVIVLGGRRHARGGLFFEPTVLSHVTPRMQIFREEGSHLVAPLIQFSTEEEALAMANDGSLDPGSSFFTRDVARVYRVARGLGTSLLGVNTGVLSADHGVFCPPGQSGPGLNGSSAEIREFLEIKYVCFADTRHVNILGGEAATACGP